MGFSVKARVQVTPRSSGGQFIATRVTPASIAGSNAGAQIVLEHALELVHVRSGELRDSGHVVLATADGGRSTAGVEFDAGHAAFAEFGTGIRGSESPMAGKGPYSATWPGMEPIPYLRPSLDMSRDEIKQGFASELSLSLRS